MPAATVGTFLDFDTERFTDGIRHAAAATARFAAAARTAQRHMLEQHEAWHSILPGGGGSRVRRDMATGRIPRVERARQRRVASRLRRRDRKRTR